MRMYHCEVRPTFSRRFSFRFKVQINHQIAPRHEHIIIFISCFFLLCTSQWFATGGGESGIPTGFDNYLFPLGREFDDSTRPEGREDCQVSVMSERMVTQVY